MPASSPAMSTPVLPTMPTRSHMSKRMWAAFWRSRGAIRKAILEVPTLRDRAMMSLTGARPMDSPELRTSPPWTANRGWSRIFVWGVTAPLSRAAVTVKAFMTEPGS